MNTKASKASKASKGLCCPECGSPWWRAKRVTEDQDDMHDRPTTVSHYWVRSCCESEIDTEEE